MEFKAELHPLTNKMVYNEEETVWVTGNSRYELNGVKMHDGEVYEINQFDYFVDTEAEPLSPDVCIWKFKDETD